jgi:hypothetical protein
LDAIAPGATNSVRDPRGRRHRAAEAQSGAAGTADKPVHRGARHGLREIFGRDENEPDDLEGDRGPQDSTLTSHLRLLFGLLVETMGFVLEPDAPFSER